MFFSRTFKQTNVTLSSTEAEHSAAVEAVKEIMWLRQLLAELGFPQLEPTPIFADNFSMITLTEDYCGNKKRVKPYIIRINFLIEQVKADIVQFSHVPTARTSLTSSQSLWALTSSSDFVPFSLALLKEVTMYE
jgi:hypothetical protein